MTCIEPAIKLENLWDKFFTTLLRFYIERCDAELQPQNEKCMNDSELYDYFKDAKINFLLPVTYIDHEDNFTSQPSDETKFNAKLTKPLLVNDLQVCRLNFPI